MSKSNPKPTNDEPWRDKAFGDALLDIIPMLRRFARRLCHHSAMAEDLTQEAVMRSWAARASFTPGTDLRAWTYVILRNCFYTALRRERWSTSWDPVVAEHILVAAPEQENALLVGDVAKAMKGLPAGQRDVLMLVGVEGLSYQEAATHCGCALGTIKSRLARGRQALAVAIDGPDDTKMLERCITPA